MTPEEKAERDAYLKKLKEQAEAAAIQAEKDREVAKAASEACRANNPRLDWHKCPECK